MKLKQLLLVLLIFGAVSALAQEFVIRDRTGAVVTLSSGTIPVSLSAGDAATDIDGIATNVATLVTHSAAIETAVEDTTPVGVYAQAVATGGASGCNILTTASTNSTSCATGAAGFYGFDITNTTTTVYYLRLYNLASAPTCSSATGFVRSIPIPPAGAAGQVGGIITSLTVPNTGSFSTGIGYCITASSASTSNDNAAAGIFGEIRYKQ